MQNYWDHSTYKFIAKESTYILNSRIFSQIKSKEQSSTLICTISIHTNKLFVLYEKNLQLTKSCFQLKLLHSSVDIHFLNMADRIIESFSEMMSIGCSGVMKILKDNVTGMNEILNRARDTKGHAWKIELINAKKVTRSTHGLSRQKNQKMTLSDS